jgi:hypothetical protein
VSQWCREQIVRLEWRAAMPTRRVSGVVALVFHPLIEQPGLVSNILRVQASDFLAVEFESHILCDQAGPDGNVTLGRPEVTFAITC